MAYTVEISKKFKARQGLKSPVLAARGLASSVPADGFEVILRVGIKFDEEQLTDRGWFVDTDAVETVLEEICKHLASDTWTKLFDFRPTFELVARWAYQELSPKILQLDYVEIENSTLKVKTIYSSSTIQN